MDYQITFFRKNVLKVAFAILTISGYGLADNPISNYHYLADPAATATDDMFSFSLILMTRPETMIIQSNLYMHLAVGI